MGLAIETINTYGTGNASLTTLAHVADPVQSLAIRSSNGQPSAHLGPVWGFQSAAADDSIFSPRMHDDVHGLQWRQQASLVTPTTDEGLWAPMYSQDVPVVQSVYGAAPGSTVAEGIGYNVYYSDLPGIAGNYMSWAQVAPLIKTYYGVKVSATSSATAGAYGAGVAINSTYDNFKANQPYALIGYLVSVACTNVGVQGSDTGNLIYGGPGAADPIVTRSWFRRMEQITGQPSIPVINSANKQGTNVYVSHTSASTTVIVQLIFAYIGA